jgi:ethanolamine ammonia-lyase small subunit
MSEELATKKEPVPDAGLDLTRFTPARVSLGQAGPAIPTREHLRFQLDHALARDAVHARLEVTTLRRELRALGMECVALRSAVSEESSQSDRRAYLRRPDLGRRLDAKSAEELKERAAHLARKPDAVFVIADGLSALAVERHALNLLNAASADVIKKWNEAPVCVVSEGRVAVGDEIGFLLGAKLVVVLIGERPGLSAPDSLGVYITWNPQPGRMDAERNCISNIRAEGLSYQDAARRLAYYMIEARRLEMTGVLLKERSNIAVGDLSGQ